MPLLGAAAWAGALLAPVALSAAVLLGTAFRGLVVAESPVADLAAERAVVAVEGTVASDPVAVDGRWEPQVRLRIATAEVAGRGQSWRVRVPVMVVGDASWADAELGERVRFTGRLRAADDASGGLAAWADAAGPPETVAAPAWWWRVTAVLREGIREGVSRQPADARALVPALVDGDDTGLSEAVADDFRTTGLTHLLAVSGTNLTLILGALLVVARWCGARGWWLHAVGALGIAGFVLLARTEPSVLRAAAMGAVGLLAMGSRRAGLRALAVAVVALLLVTPSLATSYGFALSVLATFGIVVIAPRWRDALSRYLPRWCAEALSVPLAAHLATLPLVAVLSGRVSFVAVFANLVADPVVAPATVLGLLAGLVSLVWAPAGHVVGAGAGLCARFIVAVAHAGASLPHPDAGLPVTVASVAALTAGCAAVAFGAPRLLRRAGAGLVVLVGAVALVAFRWPAPAAGPWAPEGWALVVCDVGQGDGLVLAADDGGRSAVVVDAGPEPEAMRSCLDRLGVEEVPLLVLTHSHADHVGGLAGVERGRTVGTRWGFGGDLPPPGTTVTVGELTIQVLWPLTETPAENPNDDSLVLLVKHHGITMLLTGDIEPPVQAELARLYPGLRADVLKVPHHGSKFQDLDWLASLHARVAIASAGVDNDYGHPAAATLDALAGDGAEVHRTDREGSVAIVEADGTPTAVAERGG